MLVAAVHVLNAHISNIPGKVSKQAYGQKGVSHQKARISSYRFLIAHTPFKVPNHVHSQGVWQGNVDALCELVEPEVKKAFGYAWQVR